MDKDAPASERRRAAMDLIAVGSGRPALVQEIGGRGGEALPPLVSLTFGSQPIRDAASAAEAYAAILRDPTFDIDSLVFEAPAPSEAVPAPIAVIEPIGQPVAPTIADDALGDIEAQGAADAEARRLMWERLVK